MTDIVIVIRCTEDGDHYVARLTKGEFLQRLKDEFWGKDPTFAPSAPATLDLDSFVGLVVIVGDIVVPRAVQVVTEYDL